MKAMILAAGLGKRLRPLTDNVPKPMVQVGGKHLIAYHLENLAQAGFKEVVINTSYLADKIEEYVQTGEKWGLSVQFSREDAPLETAGGIAKALPLLCAQGETQFAVVNADVWTDYDYSALRDIKLADSLGHLVLIDNPAFKARGDFGFMADSNLICNEAEHTFSGISVLHKDLFQGVQSNAPAALAPLFRKAIEEQKFIGEHFLGRWFDCGTLERHTQLQKFLTELG